MSLFAEMARDLAQLQGQLYGHASIEASDWGCALTTEPIDDPTNEETAVLIAPGASWAVSGQHWSCGRETGKPAPFWVHGGSGGKWLTLSQWLECQLVQAKNDRYFPSDWTRGDVEEYEWHEHCENLATYRAERDGEEEF